MTTGRINQIAFTLHDERKTFESRDISDEEKEEKGRANRNPQTATRTERHTIEIERQHEPPEK